MKITLILIGILVVLIGAVLAVGWNLPIQHVASRSIKLKTSAAKIWSAISDYKGSVSWRSDLKSVEQVEVSPGVFAWREVAKGGDAITYSTLEAVPENRLVRKIVDEHLPFGGSWTFEMKAADEEIELTITENGEVYNPVFRFMSRFVFGHHATIDRYLNDLKKFMEG
jgi:hypothetical protein